MKCSVVLFALAALILTGIPRAQAQDDQYVEIFSLIQQGDVLNNDHESSPALAKYLEAQNRLRQFQKMYPDWNSKVVDFRLNYLASRVADLTPKTAASAAAQTPPATATQSTPPAPAAAPAVQSADLAEQVRSLQGTVRQLQADNMVLEAKVREAFAAQPAAVDARELAKAEEQIRSLEKENALMRVGMARLQSAQSPLPNARSLPPTDSQLQGLNRKPADQAGDDTLAGLRAENEVLKRQLAESRSASNAQVTDNLKRQLTAAELRIAALESDAQILTLEKAALQSRVRSLALVAAAGPVTAAVSSASDSSQVKELQRQTESLQKQLQAAQKELNGRKSKTANSRIEALTGEVALLRARLGVYEAQRVPYSTEELALFSQPNGALAEGGSKTEMKSMHEFPAGTAALVAAARRDFAAHDFAGAESLYNQVLQKDDKNVYTLANLATIQLELNRLDEAEKHVNQALTIAPDDAYSLLVLGEIKFREEKYGDSLNSLSKAARLEPQNPEIQNFLGLALSQEGQRQPAETAFRKAIQLDPSYASAHNNLAVFYATQRPPSPGLARWHYQRALAAGFPPNPSLEKLLGSANSPQASQQ